MAIYGTDAQRFMHIIDLQWKTEMQLRPYQKDIKQKVYRFWKEGKKKVLIMSPPRSGKTIISGSIIEDALERGYRVLFTSHREKLVNQTYEKFIRFEPSVIMGSDKRYNKNSLLQIGSLQTLQNREIEKPNIIVLDEVHYGYNADMIQELLRKFPDVFIIGLSATPIDTKGYLIDGFDGYIDDYQIEDVIKLGFIVPFIDETGESTFYAPVRIDLSQIKVNSTGDYSAPELETKMLENMLISTVLENYKRFGRDKQFICHTTGKLHGTTLCRLFNETGISAGYIDATIPKKEREKIYSDYSKGILKGIFGIQILTTGLDIPEIGCVIDAAPTMILSKYLQGGMRGNTLLGATLEESILNGKSYCIYIDCAGNIEQHGLITERRKFKFKPVISRVVDRKLNLETVSERNTARKEISSEKMVYLKKIGKYLDIYEGKVYKLEKELQTDVNNFLDKTDLFWYRQNSGVAQYSYALKRELSQFRTTVSADLSIVERFIGFINSGAARFVRFTSKSGLADLSCYYKSLYFGIELKMPSGKLTDHQKKTFPEMVQKRILLFFAENVIDVYKIVCHIEENWDGSVLDDAVYDLPDWQETYYRKHKIKTYKEVENVKS
jgi:superfamily II DNA or RNA helicase